MTAKVAPRRRKLTVEFCRAAAPELDSEGGIRPQTITWDSEVTGLGIRVTGAGVRSFILDYRARTGRGMPQRRMTLSKVGDPMTLHQAREEARRIKHEARLHGADPLASRRALQRAKTVAELAPLFLAHIEAKKKPRTASDYRRLLGKVIGQRFGNVRLVDIRRGDVAKWHQSMRNIPAEANHSLRVLSSMCSWAIRTDNAIMEANPCTYVEAYPEKARERYLSELEYSRLARVFAVAARSKLVNEVHLVAISLILLTGARPGEILALQWKWLDPARAVFRLPDSKTGRKNLTLSREAAALLGTIPRIEGNPFVLPGRETNRPIINLQKSWHRVRKAALLSDVRLHDLRHAFASTGISEGLSLRVIGGLLGRSSSRSTERYAHLTASAEQDAAARVGRAIQAQLTQRVPGKLISFPSGEPIPKTPRKSG